MNAPESSSVLPSLPDTQRSCDVLVIGAGIVGVAIALRLQQEHRQVLLIDRERVAAQASRVNAGALAFSDILPLASPGILRKAPRWLFDPLGPLAIRPGYLPRIAPWLFRFWRASQPDRVRASTAAQAALMDLSAAETPLLLDSAGAGDMLRRDGVLHLYESEAELEASQSGWRARADHGIAFTHLHGPHAIAELQPGLSPALVAATFVPGWMTVSDPLQVTETLAAEVRADGRSSSTRRRGGAGAGQRRRRGAIARCAAGRRTARGGRRRRLVAPPRAHAFGAHSTRDRARLQHDTARGRVRIEAPAHLWRARLRGHAALLRRARRRRRGVCRARCAAELRPRGDAACEGQALHARLARWRAAASGWAFVRHCPIHCPRSARPRRTGASSTLSATATLA